jgi:hypothetical protein
MGTTEAELRRAAEIERARMGDTLEAIGDRLSPERMVERRKAAVGQGFRRMREAVMGSPTYVEPATQRARQQAQSVASSATETARSAASTATDAARSAADKVQHAPDMLAEQARGNPIAAGVVAFGFGLLVATAFPKTRTEQQLVDAARPQIDLAKEELRDTGRELASGVKEQAKSAAQELTSAGKEAASNVAEQAKSSAQTVAEEARNS